jgi:F0F1-type ATP synthase delta subunit
MEKGKRIAQRLNDDVISRSNLFHYVNDYIKDKYNSKILQEFQKVLFHNFYQNIHSHIRQKIEQTNFSDLNK